jgi:hypothetical protein
MSVVSSPAMEETWTLLGAKPEEVMVMRNNGGRKMIWTLRPYGESWRVFAIRFSRPNVGCNGKAERTKIYAGNCDHDLCWNASQHKNGIKLSDSRIDRILMDYCEGRRV